MKYIMLFVIVFLAACASSNLVRSTNLGSREVVTDVANYKVYKIDSINTYYLIYAKRGDSLYKIVSKKVLNANCNRIRSGNNYAFNLHSSLTSLRIGGVLISSKQLPHVNCYTYDDSTKICLEKDSINNLYYADNIKGLCYVK